MSGTTTHDKRDQGEEGDDADFDDKEPALSFGQWLVYGKQHDVSLLELLGYAYRGE